MEKTKKRTTVAPVQPASPTNPQPEPETITHVRALMAALHNSKNEFWTTDLYHAHKAAERFLAEKGIQV
jgi:hypothetical protein